MSLVRRKIVFTSVAALETIFSSVQNEFNSVNNCTHLRTIVRCFSTERTKNASMATKLLEIGKL